MQKTSQLLQHKATSRQQKYTSNRTQHLHYNVLLNSRHNDLYTRDPVEYNTRLNMQTTKTILLDLHTHSIMDWGSVLFVNLWTWHPWGSMILRSRHLIKVIHIPPSMTSLSYLSCGICIHSRSYPVKSCYRHYSSR